jgi:hypothetical protein
MTDGGRRGGSKYRSAARHRAGWRRPESHRTTPAAPAQIFVSNCCSGKRARVRDVVLSKRFRVSEVAIGSPPNRQWIDC